MNIDLNTWLLVSALTLVNFIVKFLLTGELGKLFKYLLNAFIGVIILYIICLASFWFMGVSVDIIPKVRFYSIIPLGLIYLVQFAYLINLMINTLTNDVKKRKNSIDK